MISLGLVLLVKGETQFDLLGFVLVMSASMLSGLRWTITQVLLQGADGHGERPPTRAGAPALSPSLGAQKKGSEWLCLAAVYSAAASFARI